MKKAYLLLAGMLSFAQPVEAQNYICEPGQELCPDQETCYDPKTQCCEWADPQNRVTSIKIKMPTDASFQLKDPKCSQFYFAQQGNWIPYSYSSPDGGSPQTGGPWIVKLQNKGNVGLCPGSIVVVEAVTISDCFSRSWQLGYNKSLQENTTITLKNAPTEEEDLAPTPEPQASTN